MLSADRPPANAFINFRKPSGATAALAPHCRKVKIHIDRNRPVGAGSSYKADAALLLEPVTVDDFELALGSTTALRKTENSFELLG